MKRRVTILGSTGSVGRATLEVIAAQADLFDVEVLTAQSNVSLLASQATATRARYAVIGDENLSGDLRDLLAGTDTKVMAGRSGLIEAASISVDYTMAAIVGMAGLEPLLAAIKNGQCVAIANKEPLVAAGGIVMKAAKDSGATLLPVDSEHNAVFQLFDPAQRASVRRIVLTASGGPFREWSLAQMAQATPEEALAHPNWSMGAKISVDSATMMNKALEVIEAHHFFGMPESMIDVLVHPQSIVHAMVEYTDGSILAHMGAPDMKVPITHTLGWPDRMSGPAQRLDFSKILSLTFQPVDACRFPAIKYAYDCLNNGPAACIALNAANEEAVSAFLAGAIAFTDIFDIVRKTVEQGVHPAIETLESTLAFDSKMRKAARDCILTRQHTEREAS